MGHSDPGGIGARALPPRVGASASAAVLGPAPGAGAQVPPVFGPPPDGRGGDPMGNVPPWMLGGAGDVGVVVPKVTGILAGSNVLQQARKAQQAAAKATATAQSLAAQAGLQLPHATPEQVGAGLLAPGGMFGVGGNCGAGAHGGQAGFQGADPFCPGRWHCRVGPRSWGIAATDWRPRGPRLVRSELRCGCARRPGPRAGAGSSTTPGPFGS